METVTMEEVREATCYDAREKDLFEEVINQTGADWEEIFKRPEDYVHARTGVGGFIYYSETEPFAKENMENIMFCLQSFGPLEKDHRNPLEWLSWFALEYIINKIISYKESM